MSYYKFKESDIIHSRIETYPEYEVFIYDSKIYINNKNPPTGKFAKHAGQVPPGHVNLNELNVDRPSTSLAYPFVVKGSSLNSIGSVSSKFSSTFQYGDTISGSYPLSASIVTRDRFAANATRTKITALKTTFEQYTRLSPRYQWNSTHGGDKATQEMCLLSIPSVFFGSSIKKGSVDLKFYVSGTLIGQLQDIQQNGELVQVGPHGCKNSGSTAGVILYNEGFIVLTASHDITANQNEHVHTEAYVTSGSLISPTWVHFGTGANDGGQVTGQLASSSFLMSFKGTNFIPSVTMLTHAPISELNFSANPTFALYASSSVVTAQSSGQSYSEPAKIPVKNIISSSFHGHEASFEKQTYISKVGIYDEHKNLIAVAKLANPIRKKETDSYTFKLKLDI